MALALFADDYEEVAARLGETFADWDGWEESWGGVPTPGGITQARQRLGPEPLKELFPQVARPVADMVTAGAFLGRWRLTSIDGMEWDVPDTPANAAFFGYPGTGKDGSSRPPAPNRRGLVRRQVVQNDEQPVAAGSAGPDRLQRGRDVIAALAPAHDTPPPIIADEVAGMKVSGHTGHLIQLGCGRSCIMSSRDPRRTGRRRGRRCASSGQRSAVFRSSARPSVS